VVVLLSLVVSGAMMAERGEYRTKSEAFMGGIVKGEVEKSYDELFLGTVIADKTEAILLLKEQTKTMLTVYGEAKTYEFIKQQDYGKSLVRLVYIVKCERIPLIYEFYYYRVVSAWNLVNVQVRDQYDLLADK